nr:hypothetical protein [Nocardia zapadnayensis]
MGTTSDSGRRHIAVLGAAGRVGRAVADQTGEPTVREARVAVVPA